MVEVTKLVSPDYLIEINAIAVHPEQVIAAAPQGDDMTDPTE